MTLACVCFYLKTLKHIPIMASSEYVRMVLVRVKGIRRIYNLPEDKC